MNEKRILYPTEPTAAARGHCDFTFWCPGCKCGHGIWTTKRNSISSIWSFNGDMEKPTFAPSLLITQETWTPPVTPENIEQWRKQPWTQTKTSSVCHSFIRNGMIEFLSDCTHALAGKTVPMEAF